MRVEGWKSRLTAVGSEADLTFQKAVDVSQSMEAAAKGSRELCNSEPPATSTKCHQNHVVK